MITWPVGLLSYILRMTEYYQYHKFVDEGSTTDTRQITGTIPRNNFVLLSEQPQQFKKHTDISLHKMLAVYHILYMIWIYFSIMNTFLLQHLSHHRVSYKWAKRQTSWTV